MKKILVDIRNGLIGSLSNEPLGFSSKKLTAGVIMVCIVLSHIKWLNGKDFSLFPEILMIDLGGICTLYGINVWDKFKNPVDQNNEPK